MRDCEARRWTAFIIAGTLVVKVSACDLNRFVHTGRVLYVRAG
jgi:hypothetical protein